MYEQDNKKIKTDNFCLFNYNTSLGCQIARARLNVAFSKLFATFCSSLTGAHD